MNVTRKTAIAAVAISMALMSAHRSAYSTGFTWIAANGNWHEPLFWAPYAPPIQGPPGPGDTALIVGNRNVTLTADAQGLAGLVLQAEADVFTDGNQLTVVNVGGTAQTTIIGTGESGNNTELFVEPVGGITPGFIGDNVDLVNGAELDLIGGGITHITNQLVVDQTSRITGDGTIVFTDTHSGSRLNMLGTIEPAFGDTIRLVAESGTIDLDGTGISATRLINLTNSGSALEIVGELTDRFSGRIEMRPNTTLSVSEPWSVGFGGVEVPVINFIGGAGEATITGAEMTFGNSAANLDVVSGRLIIDADSRWQSNANVDVGESGELEIHGTNAVIAGGNWTGSGAVNLDADVTTIAADTVVNMPNGTFDLDGNYTVSGDMLAINQTLHLLVSSIDDDPGILGSIQDRVQINGAAGQLNVQLTDPNAAYVFGEELELNGPGGGLTGVHLVGSDVRLAGMTNVSGSSTTLAKVEITGDVNIANGAAFNLQGGSSNNPNVVRSTAAFTGSGDLRVLSGAQLNVEDGTSTGINVVNNGRFEPGMSIGSITMRSLEQSAAGTLAMEIDGPAGIGQDEIVTTGASTVDGALEVTVLDGFIPTLGQVYSLLLADSVSGTFDDFELLSNSIFEYQATLGYPGARVLLQFTDVNMLGDFSDDLSLGCEDVDALVAEIAGGGMDLQFDLTDDGFVDTADLDEWLEVAGTFNVGGAYLPGDANLDGAVDGLDFLEWNDNKFTSTAAWCSGDFTADGIVDGQDFLVWNAHKFMSSDAMAAVPEPTSQLLLMAAIGLVALARRK